jgi:hypothetical protein
MKKREIPRFPRNDKILEGFFPGQVARLFMFHKIVSTPRSKYYCCRATLSYDSELGAPINRSSIPEGV